MKKAQTIPSRKTEAALHRLAKRIAEAGPRAGVDFSTHCPAVIERGKDCPSDCLAADEPPEREGVPDTQDNDRDETSAAKVVPRSSSFT